MPRDYKYGIPTNREAAVYDARVSECGDGHGEDRTCNPSKALIQAHRGGPKAVAAVLANEKAARGSKPSSSTSPTSGRGGTPGGGLTPGSGGGRTRSR